MQKELSRFYRSRQGALASTYFYRHCESRYLKRDEAIPSFIFLFNQGIASGCAKRSWLQHPSQ